MEAWIGIGSGQEEAGQRSPEAGSGRGRQGIRRRPGCLGLRPGLQLRQHGGTRPLHGDPPFLQHQQLVGQLHGTGAVGDQEHRLAYRWANPVRFGFSCLAPTL